MGAASAQARDTKERLLRAGERLFARDGIHGARIREINELAGQRNPSALHYHFESRGGLVTAIMLRHQSEIDDRVEQCLDELEARSDVTVRGVVDAVVRPMVAKLETQPGRDWARIIPQILSQLSENLRRGVVEPITPQTHRVLELLRVHMSHLPEVVQRERLVDYGIVLATLMAERAHVIESGRHPLLDDEQFAAHLTDVLVAVVTGPSTLHEPRAGS